MEQVDWGDLPPGVLAYAARVGGMQDMKAMRGVSRSWQEDFDSGVTGITIAYGTSPPPLQAMLFLIEFTFFATSVWRI